MITPTTAKSLLGAAILAGAVSAGHVPEIRARQTGGAMGAGGDMSGPTDLSDECQSAITGLLPIYSGLPQPPAFLLTEAATLATATAADMDPCATPEFKGDELSQWNSYTEAAMEWYSSNSETINKALASCTELQQYTQAVPICSTTGAAGGMGGNSSKTATVTDSAMATDSAKGTHTANSTHSTATDDSMTDHMGMTMTHGGTMPTSDADSSTPTPAAAPRESGFMAAAALAVAGVLGIVL